MNFPTILLVLLTTAVLVDMGRYIYALSRKDRRYSLPLTFTGIGCLAAVVGIMICGTFHDQVAERTTKATSVEALVPVDGKALVTGEDHWFFGRTVHFATHDEDGWVVTHDESAKYVTVREGDALTVTTKDEIGAPTFWWPWEVTLDTVYELTVPAESVSGFTPQKG